MAQVQQQPQAASEFYADQQRRKLATLLVVAGLWQTMKPEGNWSRQFNPLSLLMGAVIGEAQEATVRRSQQYMADLHPKLTGAELNPAGFGGWNGNGRSIEQGLGAAIAHSGKVFSAAKAMTPPSEFDAQQVARDALAEGRRFVEEYVSTAMADTVRAALSSYTAATPELTGYIRLLTPPSCSRCVVLAGKFYKWNDGFERHPKCDCVHIPETVANQDGHLADPDAYFRSLSEAEQDDVFGKAGAQAIRDGADISQVVNARSGIAKAQNIDGAKIVYTSSGTTKRGWFGGGYAARKYGDTDWFNQFAVAKVPGSRYRKTIAVRLMPESLYAIAKDRDEAIALLRRYGFVL